MNRIRAKVAVLKNQLVLDIFLYKFLNYLWLVFSPHK